MCHNSKNAQPISTKFQPLLNLYERQAWDALPKQLIHVYLTSYRALDLENDIAGGSHIEGFPTQAIPVLTKNDRGRSTVMAENNERKILVDAGHEFGG